MRQNMYLSGKDLSYKSVAEKRAVSLDTVRSLRGVDVGDLAAWLATLTTRSGRI